MITMKCYKTLFTKDGLLKNIGSYILLFTILLFLISIILFYKCGYYMLEDKIKEIYSDKVKKNNSQDYKNNIKETNDIGNEHYKGNNIKPTKSHLKKKKKKKIVKRKLKIENNYKKSFSKIELKTSNFAVYNNNSINQKKTSTKSIEQNNVKKYNDFEFP